MNFHPHSISLYFPPKAILTLLLTLTAVFPVASHAVLNNPPPSLTIHYYIAADSSIFPRPDESTTQSLNPACIGEVKIFALDTPPAGYLPADGTLLLIADYVALHSVIGITYGGDGITTFALPDLQGRVPIGRGIGSGLTQHVLGSKSDDDAQDPVAANVPSHTHDTFAGQSGSFGDGTAMVNMAPWLALTPIICTSGEFPSGSSQGSDSFIGEIKWFAGQFNPVGWKRARGQELSIGDYTAMFSLIGTIYGGDGRLTFALPDLRGRAAIHPGLGTGLTNRKLGENFGSESETMTIATMSAHTHDLSVGGQSSLTGDGQSINNVMPSLGIHHMIWPATSEVRLYAASAASMPWTSMDGGSAGYDLRGRIAVGTDSTNALGSTFGDEQISSPVSHDHSFPKYIDWMSTYYPGVSDLSIVGLDAQPNGQYINLMSYWLSTNPSTLNPLNTPSTSRDATNLNFIYRLNATATQFGPPYVEYGDLITGWNIAQNSIEGVTIDIESSFYATGVDRVTVKIPHNGNDQLFARLVVPTE